MGWYFFPSANGAGLGVWRGCVNNFSYIDVCLKTPSVGNCTLYSNICINEIIGIKRAQYWMSACIYEM
jgi:hypothetical protein